MTKETIVLTKKEIGDAIVNYIGTFKKGMAFFPYFISDSSANLSVPNSVTFHLGYIPKGTQKVDHNI